MRRELSSRGSGDRVTTVTAVAWVLALAFLVPIGFVAGWWVLIPVGLLVVRSLWSVAAGRRLSDPGRDGPRHPIDLGRLYVNEGEGGLGLHQLWEMEKRADQ